MDQHHCNPGPSQISPLRTRRKKTHLSVLEKETIIDMYKTFLQTRPNVNRTECVSLVSNESGIAVSTVYKTLSQYKLNHELIGPKPYSRARGVLDNVSDNVKMVIQRKIQEIFSRNEPLTLDKILEQVNRDDLLPNFKRSTFAKLLNEMNLRTRSDNTIDLVTITDKSVKIGDVESDMCMGRKDFKYMDTIQLSEEMNIKTELESSTLHTELDIKNESESMHTSQDRIKHENIVVEKHNSSDLPQFLNKLVKIENIGSKVDTDGEKVGYMDTVQLDKAFGIKHEIDSNKEASHVAFDSIKHENVIVEKQDRSDSPQFSNKLVKVEELEPDIDADRDKLEYMDTIQLNEELTSENEFVTNKATSRLAFDRMKSEHSITEEESTSTSSWVDTVTKIEELDIKNDDSDTNTTSDIPLNSATGMQIRGVDRASPNRAGQGSFVCYDCKYTAHSMRHLIRHMRLHIDMQNKYNCDYCDFQTNLRTSFTAHMRTHPSNNYVFAQLKDSYKKEDHLGDITEQQSRFIALYYAGQSPEQKSGSTTIICIHCNLNFENCIALDDHTIEKHPNFIASVTSKIHECSKCTFKTTIVSNLNRHMMRHSQTAANNKCSTCAHCNTAFKSKPSLDDHIMRKHPNFLGSISSKMHKCSKCSFMTTNSPKLRRHMSKHSEAVARSMLKTCIHCSRTFKSKKALDDHIIRKHPDFIASVSSKIHECSKCTFKTAVSSCLKTHMMGHSETDKKVSTCEHCNAAFTCTLSLDDHIIREHPDFISSVSSKIYKCSKCNFITTSNIGIKRHMSKHSEAAARSILKTCIHCSRTFKSKKALDDHIIRKHPDFIASVSSKIHECTKCTFKTAERSYLKKHMMGHSETDEKLSTCAHCNAAFTGTLLLDDHTIREHPEFIASVSSKIHECTKCTFKTAVSNYLTKHMMGHSETGADKKLHTCAHCNAAFTRTPSLDDHIIREHPEFIASVTGKIHECSKCSFMTTNSPKLRRHMSKHSEAAARKTCIHCSRTFQSEKALDDHIIKKHRDFIGSVSCKIYECTRCTFKTAVSSHLKKHVIGHSKTGADKKLHTCAHCNAAFTRTPSLDVHIIREHPDFIESVSSKIYKCLKCSYITTSNIGIKRHMLKHSEAAAHSVPNTCIHCSRTFKSKQALDDHIIRKHPDFIESVSCKIRECPECTYKTTIATALGRHLLKHRETAANNKLSTCNEFE